MPKLTLEKDTIRRLVDRIENNLGQSMPIGYAPTNATQSDSFGLLRQAADVLREADRLLRNPGLIPFDFLDINSHTQSTVGEVIYAYIHQTK